MCLINTALLHVMKSSLLEHQGLEWERPWLQKHALRHALVGGEVGTCPLWLSVIECIYLIGEFGSVREAFLKMEDGTVQKVAVKVLKSECSALSYRTDFLYLAYTDCDSIHSL